MMLDGSRVNQKPQTSAPANFIAKWPDRRMKPDQPVGQDPTQNASTARNELARQRTYLTKLYAFPNEADMVRQVENEQLVNEQPLVQSARGQRQLTMRTSSARHHQQQQQQQQHHHHHHQHHQYHHHQSLVPIMIDDDSTTFAADDDDDEDELADDGYVEREPTTAYNGATQTRGAIGFGGGFQHLIDERRHNLRDFHHAASLSCVDADGLGTYWAPGDKLARFLLKPPQVAVSPANQQRIGHQSASSPQHQQVVERPVYYQPNLYHFAHFKQQAPAAGVQAAPLRSTSGHLRSASSQNPLLPAVGAAALSSASSSTSGQFSSGAQTSGDSRNDRWLVARSGSSKAASTLGSVSMQMAAATGQSRPADRHQWAANQHLRVPGPTGRKSPDSRRRPARSPSSSSSRRHRTQATRRDDPVEPVGLSLCGKFTKLLLFIANLLLWSAGIALGAWGILALVDDHKYNLSQLLVFEANSRMSLFQLLSWSFITLACATILVGFCGCSALFKNNRWILGLYIFLILAIFALDLATGLLAIIFQERLVANVRLRLANKLRGYYGVQASFTAAIDYIQTRFECCGLDGHFDYDQSLWRLQRLGGFDATVARTCCHLRNTFDDQAHINPLPVNESMCQSTDVRFHQSYRYRKGCLEDLERLIRQKIWTFTIGCGAVGGVILLSLMFATCFCRSIPTGGSRKNSSSQPKGHEKSTVAAIKQKLDAQAIRHY